MLQVLAVALALGSLALWWAWGAHRGWTQTSVPVKTVDDVTGIEAISYRRQFVPGLDLLGAALLGAVVLTGASLLLRKQPTQLTSP